jgi:hypothetical protein
MRRYVLSGVITSASEAIQKNPFANRIASSLTLLAMTKMSEWLFEIQIGKLEAGLTPPARVHRLDNGAC